MGESESTKLWPGAPTAFFSVRAGSQWFQCVYCILIVCRFIMVQPYSTTSFLDQTNIGADETFIFTSRLGQSKTFPETRKPKEITVLVDCSPTWGSFSKGKPWVFHRLLGPRDRLSGPPRLGLGQCHQPSAPSAWGPAMATREATASSVEGAGGAGG